MPFQPSFGTKPHHTHSPFISQGCNRSFAELWRLKVHFRAPPDVRGSGKERGHGTELKFCPKCGKELKPGKHHVGCTAGKSAPRQAAKRQRQVSSTTESDWISPASTSSFDDERSDSWEDTVRRQVTKVQRQARSLEEDTLVGGGARGGGGGGGTSLRRSGATAASGPGGGRSATVDPHQEQYHDEYQDQGQDQDVSCRVARMQQMLTTGDHNAELVFTANTMADFGLILRHGPTPPSGSGRPDSPSPSLAKILDAGEHGAELASMPMVRVPSPPPLPPDWDIGLGGAGHTSLLFDFDQFDMNRRGTMGGRSAAEPPLMTVTSAMNPAEMSNPSDDYIWQIMFAGENEVPKRVTAHLHHPMDGAGDGGGGGGAGGDLGHFMDDPNLMLDGLDWVDPAITAVRHQQQPHQPENGCGGGGVSGKGGKGAKGAKGMMEPPPARNANNHAKEEAPPHRYMAKKEEEGGGGGGPSAVKVEDLPPPPAEAVTAAQQSNEPQTVTVTYVVQPGGTGGQPQYAVKSVVPAQGQPAEDAQ